MEKRRESIQNRAIAFILSLAMIIGIIGVIPPMTAEAEGETSTSQTATITNNGTFEVLKPLASCTSLANGTLVYIADTSDDMTGKLPSDIKAKITVTGENNAKTYIFSPGDWPKNPYPYANPVINYCHVEVAAKSFDSCKNGAIISSAEHGWVYFCDGGGRTNIPVWPYVTEKKSGTITFNVKNNTDFTVTPDNPTITIKETDVSSIAYTVGDATGTITNFTINSQDNTIGINGDNHITIDYGLDEHQVVYLPVKYTVQFDAQGGVKNTSMVDQILSEESNTVSRPEINPGRNGYTFLRWSATPKGTTAFDFSQTVNSATTIYAVWQLSELTAPDSITMTYGETSVIGATCSGDNPISYAVTEGNDVISVDPTTGVITPLKGGTAKVTVTAADTTNSFGLTREVTVTVNKRNVTLKGTDAEKTYGSNDPDNFGYTVDKSTPLVTGDTIANSFTGNLVRKTSSTQDAGTYDILQGTVDSDKYEITYVPGTFTINKKAINITLDNNTKVYGDEDPELTFTLDENTPLAYNETVEGVITGTPVREEGKDVGTYVISKGDIASPNYAITFTEGTFEITKRRITIIAEDKERFYGFQDPELTYTNSALTPLYEDDELEDLGITLEREEGEKFGEYTIKATDIKTNNYDVEFVEGTFTINKVEGGAEFDLEKTDGVKGVGINKSDQEMLDLTLTAEEWQMVEDGAGVRVYFEVTDAAATSAEESNIKSAAGLGYKIGESYDINLYKKFDHLDRTQLFTTNKKVKFTFKLSNDLTNVPDGYKREYQIVRIHDGKAEVIDSEFNAATNEVSFDSDKFSIFAVTYKDTSTLPTEIKDTVKTEIKVVEKEVKRAVKTGDAIPITSIMFLMSISAMGIGIIFKKKYTEIRNDK